MSYNKTSFSACQFNPLTDGRMLQVYPKLNEIIDIDWDDPNLDALIRYVIMVYDPVSPLIKGEKDMNHRKDVALELAGVEDEDIRTQFSLCDYPKGENAEPFICHLILRFLTRFPKSKEWAAIVATETCFWESIRKLIEPINGKDTKSELDSVEKKAKIKDEIDKDIKRLDMYYKSFYGNDPELEDQVKKRKTSPEDYARLK